MFRICLYFLFSLVSFLSVYKVRANNVSSVQGEVDVLERLNTGPVDLTCESCTHFSAPSASDCPTKWIELAILRRDRRGSLNVSSPEKLCLDKVTQLPASRDPLKMANEVEAYLRRHAGFSSLKGVPVMSQCLSEPVEVTRAGQWSFTKYEQAFPDSKHKVVLAEYYSDLHRLDRGMGAAVDNIAAIDRLIAPAGGNLLQGVFCGEMLSEDTEESCKAVRKCKSGTPVDGRLKQTAMNQVANNTIIAMKAIDSIEEQIKKLRSGHSRSRPKDWREQVARLESSKQDIENLYPWIAGRKFKKAYSSEDFKGFTVDDSTNNKELIAKMSGIITEQLAHTRDRLRKRQEEMYQASQCLTENKFCKDVDLRTSAVHDS